MNTNYSGLPHVPGSLASRVFPQLKSVPKIVQVFAAGFSPSLPFHSFLVLGFSWVKRVALLYLVLSLFVLGFCLVSLLGPVTDHEGSVHAETGFRKTFGKEA